MKVFVSYRREDSPNVVDLVAERLRRQLGHENVFKDVDSVFLGENFLDKIQSALTTADVLLVVIGPRWLNASKSPGKRRLNDPDDWVRIEVREALQRDDVRVVPLLVEGATMPGESDLPPGLKALAFRHARILRPAPMLEADLDILCERLAPEPKPEPDSKAPAHRAVDIPKVKVAGGGIQQAHTAGSPGLRRPVFFVLAAAGLALLAIALVIASRLESPSQTPPEQTGTPIIPVKPVAGSGITVPSPSQEKSAPDAGEPAKPRLFVLAFGTNTYPRDRVRASLSLSFAEDDVQSVCDAFRHQSGPLYHSLECRPLLGRAATRRAVLDGLHWLRSSARVGDLCVVYFSGYEIYEKQGHLDHFLIMTADSDSDNPEETTLSRESLADAVAEIPGRVLVLLDTCHSEAAARPITTQNPRAAVFASCRVNEKAYESREAQGGLFTTSVASGLAGRADQDGDGTVTLDELEYFAIQRVSQISSTQHPILVKPAGFPPLALTRPGH